jgi:hypothetical protein
LSSIAQKLFFSAENLISPVSADVLKNLELPKSIKTIDPNLLGKGSFSFSVIRLPNNASRIKSITASLAENYSTAKKQTNPISQFLVFSSDSPTLNFLNRIEESKFADSNFKYNGQEITSVNSLQSFSLKSNNTSNTPENIIDFKSVENPDTGEYEFHFFPKYTTGQKSILDQLNRVFWVSFYEYFTTSNSIPIPPQDRFLFFFVYSTLPVVPSKFSVSSANIYTSYFLNVELEEI